MYFSLVFVVWAGVGFGAANSWQDAHGGCSILAKYADERNQALVADAVAVAGADRRGQPLQRHDEADGGDEIKE